MDVGWRCSGLAGANSPMQSLIEGVNLCYIVPWEAEAMLAARVIRRRQALLPP